MLKNIKAGIIAIMLSLLLIPLTPNPAYANDFQGVKVNVNVTVTPSPVKAKGVKKAKSKAEASCLIEPSFINLAEAEFNGSEYVYVMESEEDVESVDLFFISQETNTQVVTVAIEGDPNASGVENVTVNSKTINEGITEVTNLFAGEPPFKKFDVKAREQFHIEMAVTGCHPALATNKATYTKENPDIEDYPLEPASAKVSCLVEPDYLDLSESKVNPSLGYIQEWLSVVDGTAKSIDIALNNTGHNEETITFVAGNCVKNIQALGGYTTEIEDICNGYPPFKNMQVRALYPSNIHLLVTGCEPA